ncbi:MAG: carboxylating nicotinate-nucleotide diphosphorylase [Candidatus Saliniplasma sp.]
MNEHKVRKIVVEAIEEDLGTGDITTESLVGGREESTAVITFKEKGVVAGFPVVKMVFEEIDEDVKVTQFKEEGDVVEVGEEVGEIAGKTRSILSGERLALNFLQRLSGIATKTRRYVDKVKDYDVDVVDTRKTTPNLRILEKYAVRVGGGVNHRMGLYDMVLIKDNHIRSAGGVKEAVERTGSKHSVKVEVEVESISDIDEALEAGADIIMLDNMSLNEMNKAVDLIDNRAIVEASGGITLKNVEEAAAAGVDVISVGALTHQISSIDIGLDLTEQ